MEMSARSETRTELEGVPKHSSYPMWVVELRTYDEAVGSQVTHFLFDDMVEVNALLEDVSALHESQEPFRITRARVIPTSRATAARLIAERDQEGLF